jgi:hypothetical protein
MACMIEMLIVLNIIVAMLAGFRVIERNRCERNFWRAYDQGRLAEPAALETAS